MDQHGQIAGLGRRPQIPLPQCPGERGVERSQPSLTTSSNKVAAQRCGSSISRARTLSTNGTSRSGPAGAPPSGHCSAEEPVCGR